MLSCMFLLYYRDDMFEGDLIDLVLFFSLYIYIYIYLQ